MSVAVSGWGNIKMDKALNFASTTLRLERGFTSDSDSTRQNCQMYNDI